MALTATQNNSLQYAEVDDRPRFGLGHMGTAAADVGVLASAGAATGAITRGHPHDRFIATDPEGNTLVVNPNHAMVPA
ncbi:MAG: hypothetical protein AB8G14_13305 [Ilumatobacter sp.]